MKKFLLIMIFCLCYNIIYGQDKLIWENSTDGLEGYYRLNIFEFESEIYETRQHFYSNDTAKSWIPNKRLFVSSAGMEERYHHFTQLTKYQGRYLDLGGSISHYSYDKIHWHPRESFIGIPASHFRTAVYSTDSTLFIQYVNRQTDAQYLYKTFITKDSIDYNDVTEYNFVPVETDFDWFDRIHEVININDILYVTVESPYGSPGFGVYYTSADGGMNWIKDSIPNVDERIRYIRNLNGRFYILTQFGIWYQDDDDNWIRCKSDEFLVDMSREFIVNYEDKIITHSKINNENVLVSSSDGGLTWERLGNSEFFIFQLITMGNKLIANTLYGIKTSTDGGITWVESNKGFFVPRASSNYRRLQFVARGNEVLTATRNPLKRNVIMKSYDNGDSWVEIKLSPNLTEPEPQLPVSVDNFFSVVETKWGIFAVNNESGLTLKTEDFGETWDLYSLASGGVFLDAQNLYERNDTLFCYFDNSIYYSNNKGRTFELSDISYRDNLPDSSWHWTIIDGIHYALGGNYELYKSDDDGRNWSYLLKFEFEGRAGSSRILFIDENRIYFIPSFDYPATVYVTDDFGKNWEEFNLPLASSYPSYWFKHGDLLFIFYTSNISLWSSFDYSSNNEGTWEFASEGLGSKHISMIHSAGDYIYASTKSGLFRAFVPGKTNVIEQRETIFPIALYPIPTRDIIKIKHNYYNLKQVKVYDINGIEYKVSNFANDYFETSNLPPGVYIANLIFEGNWSVSKKFIIE